MPNTKVQTEAKPSTMPRLCLSPGRVPLSSDDHIIFGFCDLFIFLFLSTEIYHQLWKRWRQIFVLVQVAHCSSPPLHAHASSSPHLTPTNMPSAPPTGSKFAASVHVCTQVSSMECTEEVQLQKMHGATEVEFLPDLRITGFMQCCPAIISNEPHKW